MAIGGKRGTAADTARYTSEEAGQGLTRTRSAEERRRAAAARREASRAEAEHRALSAELCIVQSELMAHVQVDYVTPTPPAGILAVALRAESANTCTEVDSIRRRHDKGHGKWPAHVSLLMAVPSLSVVAQVAVARAVAAQPPMHLTFTEVAARPRRGRADGRTHVALVLSEESVRRLVDLQGVVRNAARIEAQSSGSGDGQVGWRVQVPPPRNADCSRAIAHTSDTVSALVCALPRKSAGVLPTPHAGPSAHTGCCGSSCAAVAI